MKVFIDTGAFLALADKADAFHKTATDVFQDVVQQKALLYTSNYIIDETITLIRAKVGHKAAVLFIKGISASNIKELRISEEDEGAAKEIFIKYKDKTFSFTDCTLEVAEELMKSGYPPDAASKIYYAMFYAAQALLKSEEIDVVKHSAVESAKERAGS